MMFYFIASMVVCWSTVQWFYAKTVENFLQKWNIGILQRKRIKEGVWFFVFYLASVVLCIRLLRLTQVEITIRSLERAKLVANFDYVVSELYFCFCTLYSFLVYKIYLQSCKKGIDSKVVSSGIYLVFLGSCFSLSCVHYGLLSLVSINFLESFFELARLFLSMKAKNRQLPYICRVASLITFGMHCMMWVMGFLYLFPWYFVYPAFMARLPQTQSDMLLLLNVSLWAFCCMEWFASPIFKIIASIMTSDQNDDWLEEVLFDNEDEDIKRLRRILSQAHVVDPKRKRQGEDVTLKEAAKVENPDHEEERRSTKLSLYQTLKIFMRLKRKVKRIREVRRSQGEDSLPTTSEEEISGNDDHTQEDVD